MPKEGLPIFVKFTTVCAWETVQLCPFVLSCLSVPVMMATMSVSLTLLIPTGAWPWVKMCLSNLSSILDSHNKLCFVFGEHVVIDVPAPVLSYVFTDRFMVGKTLVAVETGEILFSASSIPYVLFE